MQTWAVTIDNKWGAFAGTIAPVTIKVNAVSYGEAVQRACRAYVTGQFKVSAVKVPKADVFTAPDDWDGSQPLT